MIGPILIITGVYWLYVAFHGRAQAMLDAITGNSGFSANLDSLAHAIMPSSSGGTGHSGVSSPGTGSPVSSNSGDSGTHMGIDANGNIVTIDKPYAAMTPAEKDAANAYAHQIGNVSG